jgi:hypothetical protein
LALVLPVEQAVAAPADLATPMRLVRAGDCTGPSHWRLSVRREGTRLRVRFSVRGGIQGQTWNVFMDHNGTGFFAGTRTSEIGGLFVVRRIVANRPGIDRIGASAHDTRSGEICRGRATQ